MVFLVYTSGIGIFSWTKQKMSQRYKAGLDRISKCLKKSDRIRLSQWAHRVVTSSILNKQPITHIMQDGWQMTDVLNYAVQSQNGDSLQIQSKESAST